MTRTKVLTVSAGSDTLDASPATTASTADTNDSVKSNCEVVSRR